jgi:hypothetical protein
MLLAAWAFFEVLLCQAQGHPKEQSTFARISGYVEQTDIHSPAVRLMPMWATGCAAGKITV